MHGRCSPPMRRVLLVVLLAGCFARPPPPEDDGAAPPASTPTATPASTPPPPTNASGASPVPGASAPGNATRALAIDFAGALNPGACVEGPTSVCPEAPAGNAPGKEVGQTSLVVSANLTLTWTSDGPASDRLVLVLATVKGTAMSPANGSSLIEGPSPLTLRLQNVTIPDGHVGVYVTTPCQGTAQAVACPRTNQAFHVTGQLVVPA